MAKSKKNPLSDVVDPSFELDLAPMLALMVTLIPMLLLSTVFVQVVAIETPLPQVVQDVLQQDRKQKERVVLVNLDMKAGSGFSLYVTVDGKIQERHKLPKNANDWDFEALHKKLITVKSNHPKLFQLNFKPGNAVAYNDIVKVLDAARKVNNGEKKFTVKDEKSGKTAETDLMFPDVVFANVVEG